MIDMKYPKYEEYEKIYLNYFKRCSSELIKHSNLKKGDRVIDLCGGNGRLTIEAVKHGAKVDYLDAEKDMIPYEKLKDNNVKVLNMSVQEFVDKDINKEKYNKMLCQQAINYWFLTTDIKKLSDLLKQEGTFVFNTFNKKPSLEPTEKIYFIENDKFIEISYLTKCDKVQHIQIRQGHKPHFTEFDWISEETFREKLSSYFDIKIIKENNTSIYVCTKRKG